jgi:hypothetical protein
MSEIPSFAPTKDASQNQSWLVKMLPASHFKISGMPQNIAAQQGTIQLAKFSRPEVDAYVGNLFSLNLRHENPHEVECNFGVECRDIWDRDAE